LLPETIEILKPDRPTPISVSNMNRNDIRAPVLKRFELIARA
jgi:hypothetical protein